MSDNQHKLLKLLADGGIWYVSSHVKAAAAAVLSSRQFWESEARAAVVSLDAERAAHRKTAEERDALRVALRATLAKAQEALARVPG